MGLHDTSGADTDPRLGARPPKVPTDSSAIASRSRSRIFAAPVGRYRTFTTEVRRGLPRRRRRIGFRRGCRAAGRRPLPARGAPSAGSQSRNVTWQARPGRWKVQCLRRAAPPLECGVSLGSRHHDSETAARLFRAAAGLDGGRPLEECAAAAVRRTCGGARAVPGGARCVGAAVQRVVDPRSRRGGQDRAAGRARRGGRRTPASAS